MLFLIRKFSKINRQICLNIDFQKPSLFELKIIYSLECFCEELIYAYLMIFMKNEIDSFKDKNSCFDIHFMIKKGFLILSFQI